MTEIAFMIREDWADHARGMERNSRRIIEWLGGDRGHLVLVDDVSTVAAGSDSLNRQVVEYFQEHGTHVGDVPFSALEHMTQRLSVGVIALHPHAHGDLDILNEAVSAGRFDRLFVMVWRPGHLDTLALLRVWGATNLATGRVAAPLDPLMLEAAAMIVYEEYNGISSGYGKDVTLTLIHALASEGLEVSSQAWATAILQAGGDWRSVEAVRNFANEILAGTKHRYKTTFRPDIVDIMRSRIETRALPGSYRRPGTHD